MRHDPMHGHISRCSICRRAAGRVHSRISIFGWMAGWHRTMTLCGSCSRLVFDHVQALYEEVNP